MVLLLFASTVFLSAALLFSVEPMVAKMTLPLVGGSPAVWGTCMVFFQAALLGGYAYAHATTAGLGVRRQAILHAGLFLLPLFLLPFGIPADAARSMPPGENPTGWLPGLLIAKAGLPFFMVATSAPLLQRWFSGTGDLAASDPYSLYAASNFGSLLALLAYPLVIEPTLPLARQSLTWAAGYGLLSVLILGCAAVVARSPDDGGPPADTAAIAGIDDDRPRIGRWLRWIALAAIPSSLMLGATTHVATDIVSIPLWWVIPLALYLISYILAFAKRPPVPHHWVIRMFPMVMVLVALLMSVSLGIQPLFIPLHLLAFFSAAMLCHGELVRHRPAPRHLTAFSLAISLGGVLGGVFNALIAPIAFDRVAEYPLALVLACLTLPAARPDVGGPRRAALDVLIPMGMVALLWGLIRWFDVRLDRWHDDLAVKLLLGIAALVCYTLKDRPARFALGLGAILAAGGMSVGEFGRVLYQHRNYFGIQRVARAAGDYNRLYHGGTLHGQQSLDPGRRREPLTYYDRSGPIGQVFGVFAARPARPAVAVVGLLAGTLACYARPGQRWTSYEIDPAVERVARRPEYFTFLRDSPAERTEVILGDARLRLRDAPEHGYGLIALDAFSSDSIPTHLLTREALALYRSKLSAGGMIAFHISNRYIDLVPVLVALARDAGMSYLVRRDMELSTSDAERGKCASIWAVMAERDEDLGGLPEDPRWLAPRVDPREAVWTDDFSDVITHFILRLPGGSGGL